MSSQSNNDLQLPNDPGKFALVQWEAARRAWLQPRASSKSFCLSSPSQTVNHSGEASLKLGVNSSSDARTREKFRMALEQMTFFYDEYAKSGHENDRAKKAIMRTADQLTDRDRVFLVPIPLGHAIAVLYRSWFHDGTIPDNYRPWTFSSLSTSGSESSITNDDQDHLKVHHLSSFQYPCQALVLRQTSKVPRSPGQSTNSMSLSSSFSSFTPPSENESPSSEVLQDANPTKDIELTKVYLTRP